ncbi:MAG: hypothetical protein OEM00_12015 [Burkholderiaceae bacterium]|nr:hypothetical protein [Burkholderiaceae bacterium]
MTCHNDKVAGVCSARHPRTNENQRRDYRGKRTSQEGDIPSSMTHVVDAVWRALAEYQEQRTDDRATANEAIDKVLSQIGGTSR